MLPWKKDSLKYYNYQCFVTGIKNKKFIVHHHFNFSKILDESLFNLGFEKYKQVKEYTEEELELITNECLRLHYKYGYGVPLLPEIHNEFHKIYGKSNNTYNQLLEFKAFKSKTITVTVADSTKFEVDDFNDEVNDDDGEEDEEWYKHNKYK